ncbi:hypothetical protein CXB51_036371 [Gossypium anomalum]|uniref:Elongation factor Ts, mitochondrial n=1 Tax=Gossypium anomalum TaxID=47600 RepID=A0A8J5XUW7_9ROSI|nr:hypothetical protein CXB51_036371 [Gossypium anomalum]
MTPVIPCSISNTTLILGAACSVRKNTSLTRCSSSRRHTRYALPSHRFILPLSTSITSFPQYRTGYALNGKPGTCISATGTEVAVEQSDSPVDTVETSEKSDSNDAPTQSKRTRSVRKSGMPLVKDEELIPGAMFKGKVRSIQPFGAFVDFGAFTDGLMHVSKLSDSFVKDVASVVSVGQEVKVRLVEVNTKSERISLSMLNGSHKKTVLPGLTGPGQLERMLQGLARKNLDGTVKNLTRSSAFISLPEGKQRFLPTSKESDDGLMSMMGRPSLQVGQEVKVRVLRITRGQVALTMKKEEDNDNLDSQLSQGVVQTVAGAIAAGKLVEKEMDTVANMANKEETTYKEIKESFEVSSPESSTEVPLVDVVESDETLRSSGEIVDQVTTSESSVVGEDSDAKDEVQVETPVTEDKIPSTTSVQDDEVGAIPKENGSIGSTHVQPDVLDLKDVEDTAEDNIKSSVSEAIEEAENKVESTEDEVPMESSEALSALEVEEVKPPSQKNDEVTDSNGSTPKENLREETGAGMMDCKKALSETGRDIVKVQEFLRKKGLASADKKASRVTAEGRIGSYIHDSRIGVLVEVNCETDFVSRGDIFKELVDDLAMQVTANVPEEIVNKEREIEMQKEDLLSKPEQIRSKIVEGRIRKRLEELALLEQPYVKNDKLVVKDWVKQTIATIGENIKVKRFVRFNLGEGHEKKSLDFVAEVATQTAAKPVSTVGKEQPASLEAKETD